jgi:outer membrane protein insertion porin family
MAAMHWQVDLTLNVVERKTGGLSCGGGISSQGHSEGALPGFIGSASFSQRNLFGLNQKLAATVEIGQVGTGMEVTVIATSCVDLCLMSGLLG